MGYVISGTTHDGTYLEVRDLDTSCRTDVDYLPRYAAAFAGRRRRPAPATMVGRMPLA